jgi:hypothetical protein
MYVKYFNTYK